MGIEEFLLDRAEKKGIERGIEKGIERGIEQGVRKEQMKIVKALLSETDFTDEKIAFLLGVSVELVASVRDLK